MKGDLNKPPFQVPARIKNKKSRNSFLASVWVWWKIRLVHWNVFCHEIISAPTAHRKRSCCVVGQTSKAKASNSFSVTLGHPAALLFLHMYTDKLISMKTRHTHMQTLLHKRVVFAVTLPYPLPEQSDVILLSKNSCSWFRGQLT